MSTNPEGESPHDDSTDDEPIPDPVHYEPRTAAHADASVDTPHAGVQVSDLWRADLELHLERDGSIDLLLSARKNEEEEFPRLGVTATLQPAEADELARDLLEAARRGRERREVDDDA